MRFINFIFEFGIFFVLLLILSDIRTWQKSCEKESEPVEVCTDDSRKNSEVAGEIQSRIQKLEEIRRKFEDAEKGDDTAQTEIGYAYYYGTGVEQDYDEAVKWLARAVKGRNTRALFLLGKCKLNGQGTEQNYQEGIKLLTAAAESGSSEAQEELREIQMTDVI